MRGLVNNTQRRKNEEFAKNIDHFSLTFRESMQKAKH